MSTSIDILRTNSMISHDDDRRISQQSIPSLSTTSTETTSTSIETARLKNGSPRVNQKKANRSPSPPRGYLYQANQHEFHHPWPMYQPTAYSPFMPHMYGHYPVIPQPLINFHDQSLQIANYKQSAKPLSKKRYMDVYEPIMPVPLAVTMEANMYNSKAELYDYDDNIPLAYFKRMSSVTNIPSSPKRSQSEIQLSTTTPPSPRRSRTRKDKKRQPTSQNLARSSTAMKGEGSPKTAGSKTRKNLTKHQQSLQAISVKDERLVDKSATKTPELTSDSSSSSISYPPNWITRFQAGIARIRLKSMKS